MADINENKKHFELIVDDFCKGIYDYKLVDGIWSSVFKYIVINHDILEFDKGKIHTLWTVNGGHLRGKVSDDNLVLSVLQLCLPEYNGDGMTLYRGECNFLFKANKIGFCWTPKIEVARMFASGLNTPESGGVLMKAFAPENAILSAPNEHSREQMDEHEYTCNPKILENITIIEKFKKNTTVKT